MNKNYALGFLIALLCVAPLASSALTTDDVQTRIKELLAKVAELTAQINVLRTQGGTGGTVSTSSASPTYQHRICTLLNRNLSQGVQGDDVRGLQEFLQSEKFLTADPTGYFGSLTVSALKRWQAAQGVDSAGSVGPKTRDRIRMWCGGTSTGGDLTATPPRGNSPLTVTFASKIGDGTTRPSAYDGQDTVLDFGDGSESRWISCGETDNAMQKRCATPVSVQHTYANNGNYVATLKKTGGFCAGACPETILAQVKIAVGPIACTKEYRPVCGSKVIYCVTTPCNPIQTTYGNTCMMEADGATLVYEGQCRTETTDPSTNPQCKSWYDGCNSCSRSTPGGPAMCTLKACVAGVMARPYCTGYFGDSTNKAPSISGFSGPTTLKVDETGTWTVKASDPEGQELSYNISWGDEAQYTASGIMTSLPVFTQTTSFTHVYSNPGTYAVNVSARDSDGKEAKVSITVKVSGEGIACTTQYDPVCGRPAGCANYCSPGMMCTMECRLHDPVTYSNRCSMNAAGAEELYRGQCQ
ncbi:MAG: peptidoglycan-binding protein [Minisyncoccia bacterium]